MRCWPVVGREVGGPAGTGVAGGVGCGVGLTTTTRGKRPPDGGGVEGGGRRMLGTGATTIPLGSAATMMGSSLGRGGRVGGLTVARSSLSGIISRMILPTDEFGFGRVVTRRRAGGGVVEENEGGNFAVGSG